MQSPLKKGGARPMYRITVDAIELEVLAFPLYITTNKRPTLFSLPSLNIHCCARIKYSNLLFLLAVDVCT